jgi:hypothetical protein
MSLTSRSVALGLALALCACIDPSDRRPGLHLSGEVAAFPADWSFTDAHQEIAIEVSGFLGLPHSVTIWCASLDGDLYLGARDPDSKRWPAWADANSDVRLKIGGEIYEVRLVPYDDRGDPFERLMLAYAAKYEFPDPKPGDPPPPPTRYWKVTPRG